MRRTPKRIKDFLEKNREIIDADPRVDNVDILLERGIRGVRELSFIGSVVEERKRIQVKENSPNINEGVE